MTLERLDSNNEATLVASSTNTSNREEIPLEGLQPNVDYVLIVAGDANPAYTLTINAPERPERDWAEKHGAHDDYSLVIDPGKSLQPDWAEQIEGRPNNNSTKNALDLRSVADLPFTLPVAVRSADSYNFQPLDNSWQASNESGRIGTWSNTQLFSSDYYKNPLGGSNMGAAGMGSGFGPNFSPAIMLPPVNPQIFNQMLPGTFMTVNGSVDPYLQLQRSTDFLMPWAAPVPP
ncbi:MAG: hypothetical protein ACC645_02280 [Pirellulales bacterium]